MRENEVVASKGVDDDMYSASNVGKERRLSRIFDRETGRTVIVPIDDSLIFGPTSGLANLGKKIEEIMSGAPNAILTFKGTARNFSGLLSNVATVVNLSASTKRSDHTRKVVVGDVKQALALGADCVAAHVNVTSRFEAEMIRNLGAISTDCEVYGMPLMAIMYPRGESNDSDENYEAIKEQKLDEYVDLVAHAGRIGVELGADIVKTPFTGSTASFRKVVDACSPVPVVIAGGTPVEPMEFLRRAYAAMQAGATGVSFGRNVFNRDNSKTYIQALKKVVHEGLTPEEAAKILPAE